MESLNVINTIAQVFAAIGTVAVAILAIWGGKVQTAIAGPKLKLRLQGTRGDLATRANRKKSIYYYVELTNERQWSPAKGVRILIKGISKKRVDGTYSPEPLAFPLQFIWAPAEFHDLLPTVVTEDVCALGFLDEGAQRFELSLYARPNNFRGYIEQEGSMRVSIIASAQNYESRTPLELEISWDGQWTDNLDEMQRHLIIKEVSNRRIE
jgi:hypothetical protein